MGIRSLARSVTGRLLGILTRDAVGSIQAACYSALLRLVENPQSPIALPTHEPNTANRARVFIAVKNVNWEYNGLVAPWLKIADIVHYDWGSEHDQYSPNWNYGGKKRFNDELYERVRITHEQKPLDIFFSYLSGNWVFPATIAKIRRLGVIAINFSFDDSHAFWGNRTCDGWTGVAGIAREFDLCITAQSPADVVKYRMVRANAVFLPPGGNSDVFAYRPPGGDTRSIPVSFIGQMYGRRQEIIKYLESKGIKVFTRGRGWPGGELSDDDMLDVYRNSLLTIGIGYVGTSHQTGLKGRDMEVPMTGCAYITTYNEQLAELFTEDREIIFYRSLSELREKISYYTCNPVEAIAIGIAGRDRAMREHTWTARWKQTLSVARALNRRY